MSIIILCNRRNQQRIDNVFLKREIKIQDHCLVRYKQNIIILEKKVFLKNLNFSLYCLGTKECLVVQT